MNIELKPYLKEINDLYGKICDFEAEVNLTHSYSPLEEAHQYRKEDLGTVLDGLSKSLGFDPGEQEEIAHALHSGSMDFIRLRTDRETMAEDEFQLLYILSRPFFKSMRNSMNMDNMFWQDGRCPVCSSVPSLSSIGKESKRKYFCSLCGCQGYYVRLGCPGCVTEDSSDITIITLEGEEGMRADTCEKCGSYIKTFEESMTIDNSPDALDILSIPLDIVAQEKGFRRQSPNPVGIIKMV